MSIPPIPAHLQLQIVSADRSLVNETVDEVEIPGADGYLGILPGHTPLLATLQVGTLWYRQGQEKHYLVIAFGFAEVQPDRVTILAQIAEKADEIDLARAERVWVGSEDFLDRLWVREGNDGRLTRHARGIAVAVAQALRHSRVRVEGITQHLQDGRRARPRR